MTTSPDAASCTNARRQCFNARDYGTQLGQHLELDSAPAFNVPGIGPEVCRVDAIASRGPEVILGLQVFEVESKPENILVLDLLGRRVLGRNARGLTAQGEKRLRDWVHRAEREDREYRRKQAAEQQNPDQNRAERYVTALP